MAKFRGATWTGLALCLITALLSAEISYAQFDSAAELHLCRNASEAQEKLLHCTNVLTSTKNRAALEIAHNTLGHALMELEHFSDAVQQFSEVIKLNPKIAGYYDNRQNAYRRLKQFDLAMADANKAIQMAPTYSFVYRGRANVYYDMGHWQDAILDYTHAIQIDPLDGGLFIDRGKILSSAQQYAPAIVDFSHALEIDMKWVGAYRERGLTYEKMGRFDLARADLEVYSRLWPQDKEIQATLLGLGPSNATGTANSTSPAPSNESTSPTTAEAAIPMEKDGGTYTVPVSINGQITLKFVVDSGASDVTIPSDVVSTLRRTGTITENDFLGSQTYVLADGSQVPSERFMIRSLKVGDLVLEHVEAGITADKGSLLLGQSFLGRFSSWSIDNNRHALILNGNNAAPQVTQTVTTEPSANYVTASQPAYQSTYFISGMLLRSSNVCGGDWQKTVEISINLIATPEMKAISSGYPESTKKWLSDGASNFNTGVMTTGVTAACQYAMKIRGEAEGMLSNRHN